MSNDYTKPTPQSFNNVFIDYFFSYNFITTQVLHYYQLFRRNNIRYFVSFKGFE